MDVNANKKSYIIHRSMGYGNLWLLGLSYWELNDFDSNITMGAPRETSELKKCMILQVVVFLGKFEY